MRVDLPYHEFRCQFLRGMDGWQTFWNLRNDVRVVRRIIWLPAFPIFLSVPCSPVERFFIALFPGLFILHRIDERCYCSRDNRNVASRRDFFETKKMCHFFISPGISSYHGESKHLKAWILQKHQGRPKVGESGWIACEIVID